MTDAEMLAWNLGRTLRMNPNLKIQEPEKPPQADELELTPQQLEAMEHLNPLWFWHWVDAGWGSLDYEADGAS